MDVTHKRVLSSVLHAWSRIEQTQDNNVSADRKMREPLHPGAAPLVRIDQRHTGPRVSILD
jgi:hypothetical protein